MNHCLLCIGLLTQSVIKNLPLKTIFGPSIKILTTLLFRMIWHLPDRFDLVSLAIILSLLGFVYCAVIHDQVKRLSLELSMSVLDKLYKVIGFE